MVKFVSRKPRDCLTPCSDERAAQGLMLHTALHHIIRLWLEREAGQLIEGPIRLRIRVAQIHTLGHPNAISGPCDIVGGGVEVPDVTVNCVVLSRLCLIHGIDDHCWGFDKITRSVSDNQLTC